MSRQIVLDTETTGLDPSQGHRIIEIGCVELIDRRLTGQHYHVYINPVREVDAGAVKVHGITNDFLKDKPLFIDVVSEFLDFVSDSELVIHNAPFDVGFINHELKLLRRGLKDIDKRCSVFDTLTFAREKHKGKKNNLDALCKRYHIDNSNRQLHGALLDAEILAHVYLAMTGGQEELFAADKSNNESHQRININKAIERNFNTMILKANEEEQQAHNRYLDMLRKSSGTETCAWDLVKDE